MAISRKLYSIEGENFKSYELIPNLQELEKEKRNYLNNENNFPLFYEIISREYPTWESKDFILPISTLNTVGGIFSNKKESVLNPLNPIPHYKNYLLEVFCRHDLMTPELKIITDDKKEKILYYFLFLSEKYKDRYRLNHFDNILSLNKKLFAYELLLRGEYEKVNLAFFDEVDFKSYFSIKQIGEFAKTDLQRYLNSDIYNLIETEEETSQKLVKKLSGKF